MVSTGPFSCAPPHHSGGPALATRHINSLKDDLQEKRHFFLFRIVERGSESPPVTPTNQSRLFIQERDLFVRKCISLTKEGVAFFGVGIWDHCSLSPPPPPLPPPPRRLVLHLLLPHLHHHDRRGVTSPSSPSRHRAAALGGHVGLELAQHVALGTVPERANARWGSKKG